MSDFTLAAIIEELERRNNSILHWLFRDEDTKLIEGTFPFSHKLTEASRAVDSILHGRSSYGKHCEFFAAGKDFQKRYLIAGNRVGKTLSAAVEVTYHITGLYPDWWEGHRFDAHNDWWVVADSSDTVRNNLQRLLLGNVGEFGTGLIPANTIDFETLKDAKKQDTNVGKFRVRHIDGSYSTITFKSYEQGRDKFQSDAVSVWLDEEPPLDIYSECVTRTLTGTNILLCTFTPLNGFSPLINLLFPDGDYTQEGDLGSGRHLTRIAMDDVSHLSPEKIAEMLAEYPEWQRRARRFGFPVIEAGAIFPYDEETYVISPIRIPDHWERGYGLDTGNRTAAVWVARDPETNIYYAYGEHFTKNEQVPVNASAIKSKGIGLCGAVDTAGNAVSPTDLQSLRRLYEKEGLELVNANKAVTTGILFLQSLFQEGRLKIFSTLTGLLKEIRSYRMEENKKTGVVKIVKVGDDRIDALRYAIMTENVIRPKKKAINTSLSAQYIQPIRL